MSKGAWKIFYRTILLYSLAFSRLSAMTPTISGMSPGRRVQGGATVTTSPTVGSRGHNSSQIISRHSFPSVSSRPRRLMTQPIRWTPRICRCSPGRGRVLSVFPAAASSSSWRNSWWLARFRLDVSIWRTRSSLETRPPFSGRRFLFEAR